MKKSFLICMILTVFFACKKDSDPEPVDNVKPEDKVKATELQTFLQGNKFSLASYYSDSAIDYNDTDQVVKAEKDLWQYVSNWIKDDRYSFNPDGTVIIEQNANRIATDTTAILTRNYAVAADENGVGFKFIGHLYQDLNYRLITFSDTLIKVSATWNGKTVNSEYKVVAD